MLKVVYREGDRQLRLIENWKEEVLAKRASSAYHLSEKGDYVFYIAQAQFARELFVKYEGKAPKLLGTKVRIIHVSPTADVVIFLDNFDVSTGSSGTLYMIRDGEKKVCLERNVGLPVIVVEKADNQYKLIYQKRNKSSNPLCVIDEKGNKHILLKNSPHDIRFYATNNDQLRTVADVRNAKSSKVYKTLIFHDEELVDGIQTGYRQNDPLDTITFNEPTVSYQQQYYNQVYFEQDTDEIIFCFSNHTSSRYFIACEIAKRAKRNIILESPYEQDDSINHVACFSREQVDDILLLHYTLTLGIDFLFTHKIFGVNVEDLFKNFGAIFGKHGVDFSKVVNSGFMNKDTSEKIMYSHIQEELMKFHGFTYRRELQAYLQRTYLIPLHDQNGKAMNFYSQHISSEGERVVIADRMKQVEEDLIFQGKMPSKWKSEAEMFRIIKEKYPSARMHASPDWLSPQHLDVYIEDMNIAFEYQGTQHFLAIDIFGGDQGLKKRLKLDLRKKDLCTKHGVKLVEWMFQEPVTKVILQQKMKDAKKIR